MDQVVSVARDHHTYQPAGRKLYVIGNRESHVPDSMGKGCLPAVSFVGQAAYIGYIGKNAPGSWRAFAPFMQSADFGMQSLQLQCTMQAPNISMTM